MNNMLGKMLSGRKNEHEREFRRTFRMTGIKEEALKVEMSKEEEEDERKKELCCRAIICLEQSGNLFLT
jgi:hypothetical protein